MFVTGAAASMWTQQTVGACTMAATWTSMPPVPRRDACALCSTSGYLPIEPQTLSTQPSIELCGNLWRPLKLCLNHSSDLSRTEFGDRAENLRAHKLPKVPPRGHREFYSLSCQMFVAMTCASWSIALCQRDFFRCYTGYGPFAPGHDSGRTLAPLGLAILWDSGCVAGHSDVPLKP